MHHDSEEQIYSLLELDKSQLPEDGGSEYNRLIFARSPYLLQHAKNLVDWYEWREDAFAVAQRENRPVLVSIGYATCHWCHVMAHESFEDKDVAKILNRYFVCIKVDREERPDIDDYFMSAAQLLTGGGGWPLNVFLTPDKRPFFAITYLPKSTSNGRLGFIELVSAIAALWRQQPDKIEQNCSVVMDSLEQMADPVPQEQSELKELKIEGWQQISTIYDNEYGGFGNEPKFPLPVTISWLLQEGYGGNEEALQMALHTLDSIRQGGIWDHLAGGVHRYSVDRKWLVPHFEKMLYDQAMLSSVALQAYQITHNARYLDMAQQIFGFVLCDMSSDNGGFYSAFDADSQGEEGKYYLWIKDEIDNILGEDSELFCSAYDVTRYGNFEGSVILHQPISLADFCKQHEVDLEETENILEDCCFRLLEHRNERIMPLCDKKIITSWNGYMIGSLAKGGVISGINAYTISAEKTASFLLANHKRHDGRLMRSSLNGVTVTPGFLEDYAFLCHGLVELYEATLNKRWLDEAVLLADDIRKLFFDHRKGIFSKTGIDGEQMPINVSLEHDGVIPSAYTIAAKSFVRIAHIAERPDLLDYAYELITPVLDDLRRHPTAHFGTLQVLEQIETETMIATVSGDVTSESMHDLLQELYGFYLPHLVVRYSGDTDCKESISICAESQCYGACKSVNELRSLLKNLHFQG